MDIARARITGRAVGSRGSASVHAGAKVRCGRRGADGTLSDGLHDDLLDAFGRRASRTGVRLWALDTSVPFFSSDRTTARKYRSEMQTPATTDRAIMGSLKRKRDDPGADVVPATIVYLKRGDLSILSAISAELPDVFTEHLLPKLGLRETLNLAQVNKTYRDAVWSVGGVRSFEAKMKAQLKLHRGAIRPNFGEADPMLWAASHGNVPAVKALLESGEDVNRWIRLESRAEYCTALHIAAVYGHAAVTKVLIEAGADINAQRAEGKGPTEGNTPLYYAVDSNATVAATVALLINAGADVDLTCKSNDSSLKPPFPLLLTTEKSLW